MVSALQACAILLLALFAVWFILFLWSCVSPAIMCPPLSSPKNGRMISENTNMISENSLFEPMMYQSQVSFECNRGYQMNGTKSVTCMATKNWTAPEPLCEGERSSCTCPGYEKSKCYANNYALVEWVLFVLNLTDVSVRRVDYSIPSKTGTKIGVIKEKIPIIQGNRTFIQTRVPTQQC